MKNLIELSKETSLSVKSICVVLGSLLGNMSISIDDDCENPRIKLKHSILQEKYFFWKINFLTQGSWVEQKKSRYSEQKVLNYISNANSKLVVIYKLVNRKNKKITRKWLNLLNGLALTIWWCDDGCLISNGKQAIMCTDSYSEKEVDIICKYFNNVLKLKTSRYKTSNGYIRISITPVKDFLMIMAKYIPCEEMIKKFLIRYKDNVITQRWISYLSEVSDYDYDTINNVYLHLNNKKKI